MPNQSIAENFLAYAVQRMQLSERDIRRCCDQLTEEQIWQRDGEHENAVGNLLLHLEGNIRQWILHGVDGQPDIRQRDDEFALAPAVSSTDARAQLAATIDEACTVIATLAPERLLEVIDPQPNGTWRHATILEAIAKVFGHLEMHTGQIILLTKQMMGRDLDLSMPRKR
jgi:uncharacterized damage-inducible protein DinB